MFYLVYFGGAAFLQPYLIVYFQEIGFNGLQISLLAGFAPLVILVGAPLWTGLADAKMRHRLIMSFTLLLCVILAVVFPLVRFFALIAPLIFIYALFASPIPSFADSATMAMLAEKRELYGRIRLGGTIGWGLLAPVAGLIIDTYGIRWAFWGYAVFMALALLICQKFTFGQPAEKPSIVQDAHTMLADRRWAIFLSLSFLAGVGAAVMNNYLAPYMGELGATKSTVGWALFIATLSELPVLFFANYLLKRFTARGLFALGVLITGLRLLLYGAISVQSGVLVFQLINGLTFPMVLVAGVSYANEIAPGGMKATAQGLFAAMLAGIGAAVGGAVGGLLLGSLRGQATFLIMGAFVLAGLGVIMLLERAGQFRQARKAV